MDLRIKYISIFLYLLTQNEKGTVKCVGDKCPTCENHNTKDLIPQRDPGGLETITEGSTAPNGSSGIWGAIKGWLCCGSSCNTKKDKSKEQSASTPCCDAGEGGTVKSSLSTLTPDSIKSIKERKGIELDISSKNNTDQYSYKVNDYGIGIYSAKSDYAFNFVKNRCGKIWSTDKQDEFADFVDVCNLGICGTEVRIFMLNRNVLILKKSCCSWEVQEESREFTACCPFFSWKCFFTLGLYDCFCKDKCC